MQCPVRYSWQLNLKVLSLFPLNTILQPNTLRNHRKSNEVNETSLKSRCLELGHLGLVLLLTEAGTGLKGEISDQIGPEEIPSGKERMSRGVIGSFGLFRTFQNAAID